FTPLAYRGTPLEPLFPLDLNQAAAPSLGYVTEGFVVQPTDLGLASPQMQLGDSTGETARIWQELPPLYWFLEVSQVKPAARVLAEHPMRTAPDGRHWPIFLMQ